MIKNYAIQNVIKRLCEKVASNWCLFIPPDDARAVETYDGKGFRFHILFLNL